MVITRNMRKRKSGDDLDHDHDAATAAAPSSPLEVPTATPKRQRKLPVRAKSKKLAPKNEPVEPKADGQDETRNASESPAPGDSSLIIEIRTKTDDDERGLSGSAAEDDYDEAEGDETIIPGAEQPAPETKQNDTIDDSDVSEDSDDEAPEAVSTSAAAAAVLKSAKAANKAIAEQQKAQKRKRQQRNAFLQDQAQTRKTAAPPATPAPAATSTSTSPASPSDDITPRTQLALESSAAFKKQRAPALLPAEFLDSDSEDDYDADGAEQASEAATKTRPRKVRKVALDKAPCDEVVGSTVYRVAKAQQDTRLAPRGGRASVNAKRALLVRGRTGKAPTKGFFVK
ncbi:hypothetical protein ACHAQH_006423 [Verticillium albo-atrum]